MKLIDLTGKKFGRLLVKGISKRKNGRLYWDCICECGNTKQIMGQHLKSNRVVSCGCASVERISILNKTHSETKTRLYRVWSGMKTRCYNKNAKSYKNYGGRGISVCKEWSVSYEKFRDWALLNGYRDDLTIDRIDNNGNYEPSNCRWATSKRQSNNTRRTILVNYDNEALSLKELSELIEINYNRLLRGFHKFDGDIELAVEYAKNIKGDIKL